MALADPVSFLDNVMGFDAKRVVKSAGIVTRWVEAVTAGGADDADNSGSDITDPSGSITDATRRIVNAADLGTLIAVRLGYDDELSSITDPVVQVFGRYDANEPWQRLPNIAGNVDATLATASADATDGTLLYTTVDSDDHIFDLLGCREVLVGVKTALDGTGTTDNAVIEVKLIN